MATEIAFPGGKDVETKQSETQSKLSQSLFNETAPLRSEMFGQFLEGLRTGGIGAHIPIIQRAIEASRTATSNALRGIDEQMATSGIAGTPFGQSARASALMQGQQAEAAIPTNILQQFLSIIPGMVGQQSSVGMSGMSAATASDAQIRAAQIAAVAQMASSAMSSGGAAGAGCWIAAALYGQDSREYWLARSYIFGVWRGPLARIVQRLYLRFGEYLAQIPWFCRLAKPFIDVAIRRMERRLA